MAPVSSFDDLDEAYAAFERSAPALAGDRIFTFVVNRLFTLNEDEVEEQRRLLEWLILHRDIELRMIPQWLKCQFPLNMLLELGKRRVESFKQEASKSQEVAAVS